MHKFCVIEGNNSELIRNALLERGVWRELEGGDLDNALKEAKFIWKPTNFSAKVIYKETRKIIVNAKMFFDWDKILQTSQQPTPIFNHFENNRVICTKTGLIRTLKSYYAAKEKSTRTNYNIFHSTPTSFLLSPGFENEEYHAFLEHFNSLKRGNYLHEKVPSKHCQENFWIVKPANQNQGKGIELFHGLREIQNFLTQKPTNSVWIVQKYIERPLLYKGRKFDIRVWGLFTQENAWFYRNGYIRTSSDNYSLSNPNNYVHLTNNCLQKHGSNYGCHEPGNTISFSEFSQFLSSSFNGKVVFDRDIVPRIKDLMIDVFLSGKESLNPNKRKNCFELLGFDFLVDEDLRTWLIEVNTNPYLGIANEYIEGLLKRMIDDLLEITVDKTYVPDQNFLRGRKGSANDFEMIYSESQGINLRRKLSAPVYPLDELNDQLFKKAKEKSKTSHCGEIRSLLSKSSITDNEYFVIAVAKAMEKLVNWERSNEQEIDDAKESMRLVAESRVQGILMDGRFLEKIYLILEKNETPEHIKVAMIEGFKLLSRNLSLRKKIAGERIVKIILTLILGTLENQAKESETLRFFSLKVLKALFGENDGLYIPGDLRENESIRKTLIDSGIGICFLLVEKAGFYENGELFRSWKIGDFHYQIDLLQNIMAKSEGETEKEKEKDNSMNFRKFWNKLEKLKISSEKPEKIIEIFREKSLLLSKKTTKLPKETDFTQKKQIISLKFRPKEEEFKTPDPEAQMLAFRAWEQRKLSQMREEQKREFERNQSIELQNKAEVELWKSRLLLKLQIKKAQARMTSKSKKKQKKKGKKKPKSVVDLDYFEKSPFYKEEKKGKSNLSFLPSLKKADFREAENAENTLIEHLVEKYKN